MLIVTVVSAAAASAVVGRVVYRWLARAEAQRRARAVGAGDETDKSLRSAHVAESSTTPEGFVCRLGDVLLRRTGEEAWLAKAWTFVEGSVDAILFVAPEAGADRFVYVRPLPDTELWWMHERQGLVVGGEPPHVLEIDGERFERRRRRPLQVQSRGGAASWGATAVVTEYWGETGGAALVVAGFGAPRSFVGERLQEGSYDVLPSGGDQGSPP